MWTKYGELGLRTLDVLFFEQGIDVNENPRINVLAREAVKNGNNDQPEYLFELTHCGPEARRAVILDEGLLAMSIQHNQLDTFEFLLEQGNPRRKSLSTSTIWYVEAGRYHYWIWPSCSGLPTLSRQFSTLVWTSAKMFLQSGPSSNFVVPYKSALVSALYEVYNWCSTPVVR